MVTEGLIRNVQMDRNTDSDLGGMCISERTTRDVPVAVIGEAVGMDGISRETEERGKGKEGRGQGLRKNFHCTEVEAREDAEDII